MSWMQKLCEVYNNCEQRGIVGDYGKVPVLLPLYHGTQQAQVELTIDEKGNLVKGSARAIKDKAKMETIIPVTEKSASRTSSPAPMPLFDKLVYVAGDFQRFFPREKGSESSHHQFYLEELRAWSASPQGHEDVRAWLAYVEKGCLIGDLLEEGVFTLEEGGGVSSKWEGGGKPQDAFVRFFVRKVGGFPREAWLSPDISHSFIAYQKSLPSQEDLCYVTGKAMPTSTTSPKFIRYPGDGAKLISANDTGGFTFRGRFDTPQEAFSLGRDTTEKAHAALKWLIRKQAYRNGDQVVLAFGTGEEQLPSPVLDTAAALEDLFADAPRRDVISTKESIARELASAIRSLSNRLPREADAIILGLDSATPGRMAVFYYREMSAKDYLDRIHRWHATCTWYHPYRWVSDGQDERGKVRSKNAPFTGAPSLMDIVLAAYGDNAGNKLKKSALERLLPCVVDSARLPRDIVSTLARRASQRAALEDTQREKVLSIACALIKKSYNDRKGQEVWTMALQPEITERSYLFGRAWAYAEAIERFALSLSKENRDTNAERLMVAFPKHPMSSLRILLERLNPYQRRLGGRAKELNDGMYEIIARLETHGYHNEPLSDLYLLGYAAQKQAFAENREAKKAAAAAQEED